MCYNMNLKMDFDRMEIEALESLPEGLRKTLSLEEGLQMTQEKLHKLFNYDATLGCLIWIKKSSNKSNKIKIGMRAGYTFKKRGYTTITIDGTVYRAHRLIWLYVYGVLPDNIDHINHKKDDNRLCNLRNVTKSINNKNVKRRKDNTSGQVGVSWSKQANKWDARITINGKFVSLGIHDNIEDAIRIRKEAERKYGFHINHGSIQDG